MTGTFIGLGCVILAGAWLVQWAKRFSDVEDSHSDDLDAFATMDLSRTERHAVAEILQARMGR